MDDFEFSKIQLWVHHLQSHPDDSAEYEEEYEILISIEDPPPYNENQQWVENVVNEEDLHDHHSEILEQSQYTKLLELKTVNEDLYKNQEKNKLEIKLIYQSLEKINQVVQEISISGEEQLGVENYLYILTICTVISLMFMYHQMKKIRNTNLLVI